MAGLVSGEPLRVLLVSPHARQREEVGDALQGAGEHRFYWVSQPDLALARASGLAPHIVLLDDDLGDGAGSDGVETLARRLAQGLPDSAVVLLVAPGSLAIAQAAVLAGARAFILKPVRGEELIPILRQVLGRRLAAPQPIAHGTQLGRVVVFCAPKGGTGRTTLAINTGVSIREVSRESVVIVDADYAAPAIDVALNLKGQRDIRDLLPKLNQLDTDLISSVLATHTSGVRVLLAPPPDALSYPPTMPQVQQVTAWLKRMFSWVLVDLGLPLDEAAYAFLDGADRVVMSVLPDMVGMRNAKYMLAQFDARNYPAGKVWPLLNREGLPGGVKKPDVVTYLARDLTFAIPNDQELATETINRGVPMVIAHRRRPVAQAYRKLAGLLSSDRKLSQEALAAAAATAAPAAAAGRAPAPVAAADAAAARKDDGAAAPEGKAPPEVQATTSEGPDLATPAAGAAHIGADIAPISDLPRPAATAGRRMPARRPAFVTAGIVVLVLLLVALLSVVALRAAGSRRPNRSMSDPPPASAVLAASLTETPTANPTRSDQATRDAEATRIGETLARILGPLPGTATVEPEGPPDQPDRSGAASGVGAVPSEQTLAFASPSISTAPAPPGPTSATTPAPSATVAPSATTAPSATVAPSATTAPSTTPVPTDTATPPDTPTSAPSPAPTATGAALAPARAVTAVRSPTDTPAATSTSTAQPTVRPTATRTAQPTARPTATRAATARPTAVRPTATRRPATPRVLPTATSVPANVSPPALIAPVYGQTVQGIVQFRWLPTGPLPAGAEYEVVWWNANEIPDSARGIAAPSTDTYLNADLAPLYQGGHFRGSEVYWTVLVVRENPYVRLTAPSGSEQGSLYYAGS